MMNVTGNTVGQVLSGPTRHKLRRFCIGCLDDAIAALLERQQTAYHIAAMLQDDRRKFQRMKLAKPLLAMMDGQSALILDVGMGGAFIEHYGAMMSGDQFRLSFRWKGADVAFVCAVRRTNVIRAAQEGQATVSQSGVEFVETIGDSMPKLQDMMATFVGRILAAQKANAHATPGQSGAMLDQMGDARRSRSRGYIAYLWDGRHWVSRRTQIAQQPLNGFTVAAHEDEDDLEVLCRTYEAADDEGRMLIRLVAELSVNSARK